MDIMNGVTLTKFSQTENGGGEGTYRGYGLVWNDMACYIWHGSEFIQTVMGHPANVAAAIDLVDEWMMAP